MKLFKVKSGGMFSPQDKGKSPAKLTVFVPEAVENIVYTKLRYQDIVIGLASEQAPQSTEPTLETLDAQFDKIQDAIDALRRQVNHERAADKEGMKSAEKKDFDIFCFEEQGKIDRDLETLKNKEE